MNILFILLDCPEVDGVFYFFRRTNDELSLFLGYFHFILLCLFLFLELDNDKTNIAEREKVKKHVDDRVTGTGVFSF